MTFSLDPPLAGTPTPKDYHRIHFDPSNLPPRRIVGLLACQRKCAPMGCDMTHSSVPAQAGMRVEWSAR